ncbi:MAG: carboxypeptidase M32 [Candidatus Verstraetearchaeota archaeon]|nr:carboxypeptidase M32 [Candidatus Verstraetearchaeota archaeon]
MPESALIDDYNRLMEKDKEIIILSSVDSIIKWDMETKMPPGAFGLRSQQLALLSQIDHRMTTDPEIGALLGRVEGHQQYQELSEFQRRNVYLVRKFYDENTRLPEKLVSEMARQQAVAYEKWKKAKAAKDFSMFKPDLEKMFELKRQSAEILMEPKGVKTPYDAMIDLFEPKVTQDIIARTFDELRGGLIPIIRKCVGSAVKPDTSVLKRRVPVKAQEEISRSIARFIGYDMESEKARGRIDETEHPFTIGYYDDVRITTHYFEENFASSLFSVLHEGGHAMYDQNLKGEWMYQPVGTGCSYGFHESQSRFVENMVGRSYEFWEHYLPELKRITSNALADVDLEGFVPAVNVVRPSKIRIEADEATYSLHVIIRFELERDLFAGKVTVGELPAVWNQKYRDYLGVEIENDSEGVLQDVHWAHGYFGYFPSYALGNIYGGQILYRMEREMPQWRESLSKGNFHEVREWLMRNVHAYGNLYDPLDLLRRVSGEGITPKHFIDYLDSKYSKIYGYK